METITEPLSAIENDNSGTKENWIPVLVGILLSIIVVFLWWTLNNQEKTHLQNKMEEESQKLISYIDADLRGRIPAIQRIVMRWEEQGGTPKEAFESDIRNYISDLPGFQAIAWVDKNYIVRWIVPLAGNEQVLRMNLSSEEGQDVVLETAQTKKKPTMTSPLSLAQGGLGFLIYFPIEDAGNSDGFILASFRIQEWLDYVFTLNIAQEISDQFSFMVSLDNRVVYRSPDWINSRNIALSSTSGISELNHLFTIDLRPTQHFLEKNSSILPEIAAGIGLLLSFLISVVVYLYQKASKEIWHTRLAASSLEQEIREHKRTEAELNKTSNRLELATKAGNIGVWSWDIESGKLSWNRIMFDIYDIHPDIVPTYETWSQILHPEDKESTEKLFRSAVDGKTVVDTEFRILRTGDEVRNIRAAARVERDLAGTALRLTGVIWDITEAKRTEEKIKHMATHDALTGLPGLHLIKDRIVSAVKLAKRNQKKVAVMFIDIDGFKSINDTHGHDTGDALLKEIAIRLRSELRETDTAGRIGGDEFLLVAQEIKKMEDAAVIAVKIVRSISHPVFTEEGKLEIGASIGIAIYPDNGSDAESLIKEADKAMYKVKKNGKNGFRFSDAAETPG